MEENQWASVKIGPFFVNDAFTHLIKIKVVFINISGRIKVVENGKQVQYPKHVNKPLKDKVFKNLRWTGGDYVAIKSTAHNTVLSEAEYKKQFQQNIDDSIEIEKREEGKK